MNRILVTGATGTVGNQVLSKLKAAGAVIRAMARNPSAVAFPPGIDVMSGDLTRPETMDACLEGVDTVFLVWVAPPQTFPAVLERIAGKARRIVFLSAPLKTPHPLFQQPNAGRALAEKIELLIQAAGLEWTFLRPGMFAANAAAWWGPQIRAGGRVRWPYLSVPTAPIHESDIAAVAVRALLEEGHASAEYVLTGPESLSQAEQISTIGEVIGRRVICEDISPDEARRELLSMMPLHVVNMLLDAWSAASGQPAFVVNTVAQITGRPARSFREWVSDNVPKFNLGAATGS